MNRFLMVDIGAGTMDVLYFDTTAGLHYKAVVTSPVPMLAKQAAATPGNLLVTGVEMGGGGIAGVLRARAEDADVVMSRSAAATLHHDPERVRSWGISVVEDAAAGALIGDPLYAHLVLEDLNHRRIKQIVEGMGVDFEFDAVAVCAQDHGVPPVGDSHLDFRHQMFQAALDRNPSPHHLLYPAGGVPAEMNRLNAIAAAARMLPTKKAYVMDSGMAAILGASMDHLAAAQKVKLVLDVATSHTVGAVLAEDELAGFFEYHTRDITREKLETLIRELADGELTHDRILAAGGHGATIRRSVGFGALGILLATGPKRRLVEGARLPMTFGAPLGDNMMTGTVGLLEAVRRKEGLPPIRYL
jgi:uncharacterized protein (DUF1786 family)